MRTYRVINGFGGVEDTVNACIKSGGIIPDFKKIGWCVTKKEYPHVSKADYDKIYAACKKHIPRDDGLHLVQEPLASVLLLMGYG